MDSYQIGTYATIFTKINRYTAKVFQRLILFKQQPQKSITELSES